MTQRPEDITQAIQHIIAASTGLHRDQGGYVFTYSEAKSMVRMALAHTPAGVPREHPIFAFLLGEASWAGVWFGDKPEGESRGNFWWRADLRAALDAAPQLAGPSLVEQIEE